MDVHMPGGGGHAVAAEMLARYPRLTVVLLSVDTSPHVRAVAEEQNVQFVPKSEFWTGRARGVGLGVPHGCRRIRHRRGKPVVHRGRGRFSGIRNPAHPSLSVLEEGAWSGRREQRVR